MGCTLLEDEKSYYYSDETTANVAEGICSRVEYW